MWHLLGRHAAAISMSFKLAMLLEKHIERIQVAFRHRMFLQPNQ